MKNVSKTVVTWNMANDVVLYIEEVSKRTHLSKSVVASKIMQAGIEKFDNEVFPELVKAEITRLEAIGNINQDYMPEVPVESLWHEIQETEQRSSANATLEEESVEFIPPRKAGGIGRFRVTNNPNQGFRCTGACGQLKPVNKFPTITTGTHVGYRHSECRECATSRRQGLSH